MQIIGHHVEAYDANGRTARPGSGFATEVWADFDPREPNLETIRYEGPPVKDSLAEARAYAQSLLERYPTVATVTIQESVWPGYGSWTLGKCVDTITRPAAPEAAKPNCQGGHNFNGSGFRCWCGAISID